MNQLDLKQRVAVVTGGARGIGYAVAERVLRSGGVVSLWDIDATQLGQASDRLSPLGQVESCVTELTRLPSIRPHKGHWAGSAA